MLEALAYPIGTNETERRRYPVSTVLSLSGLALLRILLPLTLLLILGSSVERRGNVDNR